MWHLLHWNMNLAVRHWGKMFCFTGTVLFLIVSDLVITIPTVINWIWWLIKSSAKYLVLLWWFGCGLALKDTYNLEEYNLFVCFCLLVGTTIEKFVDNLLISYSDLLLLMLQSHTQNITVPKIAGNWRMIAC